jgi:hypothetical protein
MKDDANLVILAAQVAEIGHSLWLKTTSSRFFRSTCCSQCRSDSPASALSWSFIAIADATGYEKSSAQQTKPVYLRPSAQIRGKPLATMAPNLLFPLR